MKITPTRNRRHKYAITELTTQEKLQRLVDSDGPLTFKEVRDFPDGFESAIGAHRGRRAFVMQTSSGGEVLLARTEAEYISSLGTKIPLLNSSPVPAPKRVQEKLLSDVLK